MRSLSLRNPVLAGAVTLFLLLASAYTFSIGLRATRGASISGDEPFYLVTTQSIIDDGNLDLRAQYASESYRSFFGRAEGLWMQSVPLEDGSVVSPHEPGLSVLIIPGFALAGLRGVQVELMLLAAATFSLAFVLTATETKAPLASWLVTAVVGLSATAFVYATEVYPEIPGAFCIVLSLLLLRRTSYSAIEGVVLAVLLTLLMWLGLKYAPLGCLVAAVFLWRADMKGRGVFVALSAVSALAYAWAHLALYNDLTAYSTNTVYEGAPAASVLQAHLGLSERIYRLWGLFTDRRFGIGHWAPIFLLVMPALPLLLTRERVALTVAGLIVTQVMIATFLAITMMGWWFPGRTLMTIIPLFPLVLTTLLLHVSSQARLLIAALAAYSVATTFVLVEAVRSGAITATVDPFEMRSWLFRLPGYAFPDYRSWSGETWLLTVAWLAAGVLTFVMIVRPGLANVARMLRAGLKMAANRASTSTPVLRG